MFSARQRRKNPEVFPANLATATSFVVTKAGAGTVTTAAGDQTVTNAQAEFVTIFGAGTAGAGSRIRVGNQEKIVLSVTDQNQLEVTVAFSPHIGTAAPFVYRKAGTGTVTATGTTVTSVSTEVEVTVASLAAGGSGNTAGTLAAATAAARSLWRAGT